MTQRKQKQKSQFNLDNPIIKYGGSVIIALLVILAALVIFPTQNRMLRTQVVSNPSSAATACTNQTGYINYSDVVGSAFATGFNHRVRARQLARLDAINKMTAIFQTNLSLIVTNADDDVSACSNGCLMVGTSVSCTLVTPSASSCDYTTTPITGGSSVTASCPTRVKCVRTCEASPSSSPSPAASNTAMPSSTSIPTLSTPLPIMYTPSAS